jgi:hypothetical protein
VDSTIAIDKEVSMPMNAAEQKRLENLLKDLMDAHARVNNMQPKVKGVLEKGNVCFLKDTIAKAKTPADTQRMETDNRALGILKEHVETFLKESKKIWSQDKNNLAQKYGTLFELGQKNPKLLVSGNALFGSVNQLKNSEAFYKGPYFNACMAAIGQNMIAFGKHYQFVQDVLSRL